MPVQCNHTELVAESLGNGNRIVQSIRHSNAPQEGLQNTLILLVALAQVPGDAHKPLAILQARLRQGFATNGRHGQERGSSAVLLLQHPNGSFGILFIGNHDVLRRSAQGGFNGESVVLRYRQQTGYGTVNTRDLSLLCKAHDGFDAMGKAL